MSYGPLPVSTRELGRHGPCFLGDCKGLVQVGEAKNPDAFRVEFLPQCLSSSRAHPSKLFEADCLVGLHSMTLPHLEVSVEAQPEQAGA